MPVALLHDRRFDSWGADGLPASGSGPVRSFRTWAGFAVLAASGVVFGQIDGDVLLYPRHDLKP